MKPIKRQDCWSGELEHKSNKTWLKHLTVSPGIVSLIPPHPTKIYLRSYTLVLPRKNAPVYQCFTLGTIKNLVCHVWWALQYLAQWATNRNCRDAAYDLQPLNFGLLTRKFISFLHSVQSNERTSSSCMCSVSCSITTSTL